MIYMGQRAPNSPSWCCGGGVGGPKAVGDGAADKGGEGAPTQGILSMGMRFSERFRARTCAVVAVGGVEVHVMDPEWVVGWGCPPGTQAGGLTQMATDLLAEPLLLPLHTVVRVRQVAAATPTPAQSLPAAPAVLAARAVLGPYGGRGPGQSRPARGAGARGQGGVCVGPVVRICVCVENIWRT